MKGKLNGVMAKLSNTLNTRLQSHHVKTGIPKGALLAIALRNELEKETPFAGLKVELPSIDELGPYEGIKECQIIGDFIGKSKGKALPYLLILRNDLGIDSDEGLLAGLTRAIEMKKISKTVVGKDNPYYAEGVELFVKYREEMTDKQKFNKMKKAKTEAEEYEEYQKLKKKYEGK